jgi:Spy/CpxP family protein refolding chaperone
MRRRILFLFLGLTLAGASLAWGQPGKEFGGGGGFQDRFLEVKRNQLGPALGVNQQTVDQLLAIDARYKPLRHQLTTGMRSDMQRLQQLMSQPSPPEQEIKPLLADMKRKRLEMLNLQQRKDDEETALLTPMQQARYLMYLMSLIKEARNVKSGAGGPGGMGAPGGMAVPTLRPSEIPVSRPSQ